MSSPVIGTLKEHALHASLKRLLTSPGDQVETPVAGFVVDIVRPGQCVEIQTAHFGALKRKLAVLLPLGPVRVVYPLSAAATLVIVDGNGEILRRRRSPKHAVPAEVFSELVSIPELVAHPNFSLEIIAVELEHVRQEGRPRRGRRRYHKLDSILVAVRDRRVVVGLEGFLNLAAAPPTGSFTTADLARLLGQPLWLAQKAAYCLRKMGALEVLGRDRRGWIYASSASALSLPCAA